MTSCVIFSWASVMPLAKPIRLPGTCSRYSNSAMPQLASAAPRHPTMFKPSLVGPNDGGVPTLERWTIDLAAGKVREELVDERGQEFPRVNETLLGVTHRFGYASVSRHADAFDGAALPQARLRRRHDEVHDFGTGRTPSEFVFVPSADGRARTTAGSWATCTTRRRPLRFRDPRRPRLQARHPWRPCAYPAGAVRLPRQLDRRRAVAGHRLLFSRPGRQRPCARPRRLRLRPSAWTAARHERPQLFGDAPEVRGRVQPAEDRGETEVDALRDHERGRHVRRLGDVRVRTVRIEVQAAHGFRRVLGLMVNTRSFITNS